jgi:uncharacterized DUF497 family protein
MYQFWWDDENIEHIAAHGIMPEEAEQVIDDTPVITCAKEGKYIAFGQTDAGRYLIVVFAEKAYERLRVIAARDMTNNEKKRFRRRKK